MIQDIITPQKQYFADGVQTILRGHENRARRVILLNGNLVTNTRSESRGISARVTKDGRHGFSSAAAYTEEDAKAVLKAATENALFLSTRAKEPRQTFPALQGGLIVPERMVVDFEQKRLIDAVRTGRNDLEAAGCKFSGNAYYQVPGGHCQHGTLLVHCNMSRLGEYLTVSPEKLKKHAVSSVRSRVVNLADLVPGVTIPRLSAALQEAFEAEYGPAETGRLPDRERVEACAALLRSDDWIYGRRIPATQTWKGSFPWGHFELHLVVQQGLIRDARAVTDMLDSSIPHAFAAALIGEPCLPGRLVEAARRAGGDAFAKDMAGLACTQD